MNYITTARKPSVRVRTLAKQLAFLFEAEYFVRGKSSISDIVANARYAGIGHVLIITEKDGNPRQLLLMEIDDKNWAWKETYFIKILRTRNELVKENLRIRNFKVISESKPLHQILRILDVDEGDSDIIVKDIKNGISVFQDKKEIGPAFDLEFSQLRGAENV